MVADEIKQEVSPKPERMLSRGLLMMVISHGLIHAAGNMRGTLNPIIKEEFMLNNFQIGVMSAVPPLAQALFSIPAGWISDRYGAKKLVAFSMGLAAAGALVAGFSLNPWMFVISAVMLTLTSTFYHPPAHSYAARAVGAKDRSKAMGLLTAGGTFGVSVGPLSITIFVSILAFTWRQLYLLWVIPIILGLILLLVTKTDPRANSNGNHETSEEDATGDEPESLLSREFLLYISSRGVRMFATSMVGAFLSIYLNEARGWTVGQIGLMFGIAGVLGLVGSPLGGYMASRFGEKRWVVASMMVSTTLFLATFYMQGVYPFMAMYLVYRFFGIMSMPGMSAITARLSPPKQIGMGFALTFMPSSITGIVGPMIGAWIADTYGYFPIFIAATAILYLGIGIFNLAVKD